MRQKDYDFRNEPSQPLTSTARIQAFYMLAARLPDGGKCRWVRCRRRRCGKHLAVANDVAIINNDVVGVDVYGDDGLLRYVDPLIVGDPVIRRGPGGVELSCECGVKTRWFLRG